MWLRSIWLVPIAANVSGTMYRPKAKGIDLFFSYYYSPSIDPRVIDQIRELGVPAANFYCNLIPHFELIEEITPHFDLCWMPKHQAFVNRLPISHYS